MRIISSSFLKGIMDFHHFFVLMVLVTKKILSFFQTFLLTHRDHQYISFVTTKYLLRETTVVVATLTPKDILVFVHEQTKII